MSTLSSARAFPLPLALPLAAAAEDEDEEAVVESRLVPLRFDADADAGEPLAGLADPGAIALR